MRKPSFLPRLLSGVVLVAGLGVLATRCSPSAACDATSCATGCCDATGTCVGGAATAACGNGGRTCQACTTGQTCTGQICMSPTGSDGGTDSGTSDAGAPDAGVDAGTPDAGAADAGARDSGVPDAGTDAGSTFQSLAPCTTSGMYVTTGSTITFPNGTYPNFSYAPKCLTVRAGTVVTWSGTTAFSAHPLSPSTRGTKPSPITLNNSAASMTTMVTFNAPGFYPYYCTFHGADTGATGSMNGVVQVIP